jgi:hypothetical protein
MPPPEVIALADEVRAHLDRSDLVRLGPIELPHGGGLLDAELAARIVLADVAHCTSLGRSGSASATSEKVFGCRLC